jgi:hypothetical protein
MATIQAGAFHRRNFDTQAFEKLTINALAGGVPLSGTVYAGTRYAVLTVEAATLRFTVDGTPPTPSVGHLVEPGDIIRLNSHEDIVAFRAIRTAASDGILQCSYGELKLTA